MPIFFKCIAIIALLSFGGCTGSNSEPVKISYDTISLFANGPNHILLGVLDSNDKTPVSFPFEGKIAGVNVELGDQVDQDQPMASLDIEDYQLKKANAEANLDRARNAVQAANNQLTGQEQMLKAGVGTQQDYDTAVKNLVQAKALLAKTEEDLQIVDQMLNRAILRAPKAGLVSKRDVKPGDFVGAGQVIFEIHPAGSLRAVINIPDELLVNVRQDMKVSVNILDLQQNGLNGTITQLLPKPTNANATPALANVDPQQTLRAGMKVEVLIPIQDPEHPFWWIPVNTLLSSSNETGTLFLYDVKKGVARKVEVRLGEINGDRVKVTEGLKEGDRLITRAAENLQDGQLVTAVTAAELPNYLAKPLETP